MTSQTKIPENLTKFLLVRTDRLGDLLLSTPVAAAIKKAIPNAHITFLVQNQTKIIAERNNFVDEVITIDEENGSEYTTFELAKTLRARNYDCAVLIHPTFKLASVMFLARIPVRAGTGRRFYSPLFNRSHSESRKASIKHESEYNLGLLTPLNIPFDKPEFQFNIFPEDETIAEKALTEIAISREDCFCVIHPGSRGSAMDWPPEYFSKICGLIKSEFNLTSVITWGPAEDELANEITGSNREFIKPLKKILPLPAVAALLRRSEFLVAPSTGILHIANTIGTPIIGIYPPVRHASPVRWGPYGNTENCLVPGDKLYNSINDIGPDCMKSIQPTDVIEVIKRILSGKS